MSKNEITSSIQLAARLTDSLYRESIVNADSAQALFDVLADALAARPDVVAAVSEDLRERQREKDEYLADVMKRLDTLEQDYLRWYHTEDYLGRTEQIDKDAERLLQETHNND